MKNHKYGLCHIFYFIYFLVVILVILFVEINILSFQPITSACKTLVSFVRKVMRMCANIKKLHDRPTSPPYSPVFVDIACPSLTNVAFSGGLRAKMGITSLKKWRRQKRRKGQIFAYMRKHHPCIRLHHALFCKPHNIFFGSKRAHLHSIMWACCSPII